MVVSMVVVQLGAGLALAGCSGLGAPGSGPPGAVPPTVSTGAPYGVDQGELETPNSLPVGDSTRNPIAPETGVVGVTHLPSR